MANMGNISSIQHESVDKQKFQTKNLSADVFDKLMLEQIAEQVVEVNQVSLSKQTIDENEEISRTDKDCHIDAFIQQAFSQAPETEKKIWARMKEELGI